MLSFLLGKNPRNCAVLYDFWSTLFIFFSGTGEKNNKPVEGQDYIDPSEALNKLLHLLSRFNTIFQKHGLDPQLISRIFRESFYYICAGTLNNILLRKDMCHWSKGMQIRYNVAQVEQWARDAKIHDNDRQLFSIDTLEPIIQAAALLQVIINFENIIFSILQSYYYYI